MASDPKNPTFTQPPLHEPADAVDLVGEKKNYDPDGIVGDQLSEIDPKFEQPPRHVPAEAINVVGQQAPHVPAEAINIAPNVPTHDPSGIVGDDINEIRPIVPDMVRHDPTRVIGDSLEEIQPAPPPLPAAAVNEPFQVSVPDSHVPQEASNVFVQPPAHVPALSREPNDLPFSRRSIDIAQLEASRDFDQFVEIAPYAPNGQIEETPYSQIVSRIRYTDSKLANYLSEVGIDPFSITGVGGAGSRALDPTLYAKWLVDLGKHLGIGGFAQFMGQQFVLHAMNAEASTVFDPLYFVNRAPIINGMTRDSINTGAGDDHAFYAAIKEEVSVNEARNAIDGTFSAIPGGRSSHPLQNLSELNVSTPITPYEQSADITIRGLVDAALKSETPPDDFDAALAADSFLDSTTVQSVDRVTIKASAFFEEDPKKFSFKPTIAIRNKVGAVPVMNGTLEQAAFPRGIIPAKFAAEEDDSTVLTEAGENPSDKISDDTAYVPLCFTDLRPNPDGTLRTVFFRPFITSLNESFAPSYNESVQFGRVEPVNVYQSTTRTYNLGFELHAFSPEDVKVIYQKLHWLASMVYPEYDSELLMKSGPVCRLRLGDIVKSGESGISGVIKSLDYDYTDSLWELKKNYKVPRSVAVSLSFTVLHDSVVGIKDGVFGAFSSVADTNGSFPLVRGKFRGFGEP